MSTTTRKSPKTTASSSAAPKKTTRSSSSSTVKPAAKPAKPANPVLDGSLPDAKPDTAPAPAPSVVAAPQSVILGPVLRKKELIDKVVTRSGLKKKDVKPVVEAMLAELGDALADNRELNLHPLGKLKVQREKKMPNGRMMVAKIRQPKTD